MGISGIGLRGSGSMCRDFLLVLAAACAVGCTPVVREYRDLKSRDYNGSSATRVQPVYRGDSLRNIRFPAGGLGTGRLFTGGRGNLQGIVAPALEADLSGSVFFLRVIDAEGPASLSGKKFHPVLKIMEGSLFPDQAGSGFQSIPYPGISRFSRCSFQAGFPFGRWELADPRVPVSAELEIFSPFVPLERQSSSYPAAVLHWRIRNPLDRPVDLSLVFRVGDPFFQGRIGEGKQTRPTRMETVNAGDLKGLGFISSERNGRGPVRRLAILSLASARPALSPGDSTPEPDPAGPPGLPAGTGISGSISLRHRLDAGEEWVVPLRKQFSGICHGSRGSLPLCRCCGICRGVGSVRPAVLQPFSRQPFMALPGIFHESRPGTLCGRSPRHPPTLPVPDLQRKPRTGGTGACCGILTCRGNRGAG
jgi:hypothetical protein